ncbi:cytochrome P450 monooxygenase [Seiridium cupressi]
MFTEQERCEQSDSCRISTPCIGRIFVWIQLHPERQASIAAEGRGKEASGVETPTVGHRNAFARFCKACKFNCVFDRTSTTLSGENILAPMLRSNGFSATRTTCQSAKGSIGAWDEDMMDDFEPRRWLKPKDNTRPDSKIGDAELDHEDLSFGAFELDPHSGPALTLRAGPRGCAARRLAYMELRIIVVMLVWNFQFDTCPLELSSHDATEYFTTVPDQCYARLREANCDWSATSYDASHFYVKNNVHPVVVVNFVIEMSKEIGNSITNLGLKMS